MSGSKVPAPWMGIAAGVRSKGNDGCPTLSWLTLHEYQRRMSGTSVLGLSSADRTYALSASAINRASSLE